MILPGSLLQDLKATVECKCANDGVYCESCKLRFQASRILKGDTLKRDEEETRDKARGFWAIKQG
jgi:hypothetical protein